MPDRQGNRTARRLAVRWLGRAAVTAALACNFSATGWGQDGGAPVAIGEPDARIRVAVMGDSLADGIWAGLYRELQGDDRFEVLRRTEVSSGLSRPDFYDWEARVREIIAGGEIDVAVVCFGLNDPQPVYFEGKRQFSFGSPEWNAVYEDRVAEFQRVLRDAGIPTFWVGLPTVRSSSMADDMAHLNTIYEAQSIVGGATFVPTLELTTGPDGGYSAYLVDESGRNRLMRANDGVHFTARGYSMLARELLRTMADKLSFFNLALGDG